MVRTVLVKGGEDLRLDNRILQIHDYLVRALLVHRKEQRTLHQNSDPREGTHAISMASLIDGLDSFSTLRQYRAIPLSTTCGLVEWIEDAPSVFRVMQKRVRNQGDADFRRPLVEFADAAKESLAYFHLPETTPRKEWPLECSKRVFRTLLKSVQW